MLEQIRNKARIFNEEVTHNPKICVLSRDNYLALKRKCVIQAEFIDKVYGLTIIITEKPNIIEVF